ncbi:MAG: two-component regulator propeller domain-containing protein [Akkermansiaceae bacterium]
MKPVITAIALTFLWVSEAAASPPDVTEVRMLFRNWTTRDGLPHNRVRSVARTSDGFLWLATDAGVARFDGATCKVFGLRDGLPSPTVLTLHEAADKSLWCGTLGGGLGVLRDGKVVRTYSTADGLPANWIYAIDRGEDGNIIVNTRNGAARFIDGKFQPIPPGEVESEPRFGIVTGADGVKWGILRRSLMRKSPGAAWRPDASGPPEVGAIWGDPGGAVWAYGGGKLWKYDGSNWVSWVIPFESMNATVTGAVTRDGTVWIAFRRRGLIGFRDGSFIVPVPVNDFDPDMVETIAVADGDHVWLTTMDGLNQMTRPTIESFAVNDPASLHASNDIGDLVEDAPGELVLATQGSGYFRWKNGVATRIPCDPGSRELVTGNAVFKDRNGSIWLGGRGRHVLYEIPPGGVPVPRDADLAGARGVWSIAETASGLWVGTGEGGLFLKTGDRFIQVPFSDSKEPVKAVIEDRRGCLWVATRGSGLYARRDGVWKRYGKESGLLSEDIRAVYEDTAGRIWVGSNGGGLAYYAAGRFITVTRREGLPSDTVSQITMDDVGRLWVGTHHGLAVVESDELALIAAGSARNIHPQVFDQSDGLPTDEFAISPPMKAHDGAFYLAMLKGFVRVEPGQIQRDESRPPAYIAEVSVNGVAAEMVDSPLDFPPGTDRIKISFSGIHFGDHRRLRFRSRLAGVDPEWTMAAGQEVAEYRQLDPGKYRFEVEASIGNDLWSARPAAVEFSIAPFFWQTLWFKGLLGAVVIGVAVTAAAIRERRIVRKHIEAMERKQAVDAERSRIARDLHDDVGSGLTQIAMQSQLIERNLALKPERAALWLGEIFNNAKSMTRALDEIVWAVNPKHDTLENFILFLGTLMQDFAEASGLRSRFDVPEGIPEMNMPPAVRHHLYLAVKEILHNVVKHAQAEQMTLQVRLDQGHLCIAISDDGKGFAEPPDSVGADGLGNMRSRLEQIRGTCNRTSNQDAGTSVHLRVPMNWMDA